MSAGYSGTPLARKLGIRPGHRIATLNAPADFPALLEDLPEDVVLDANPPVPDGWDDPEVRSRDVVILFARDARTLERDLPAGHRLLAWDGGLWLAWPKLSSPLAADLRSDHVRGAGLATGLVDNKVCAIDADWSGLRFVYRVEHRP